MDKNTYIHDQFNTWQKCRQRYYFKYVKELGWPETEEDFTLGKNIHALMNYYLRGLNIDHLLKNLDDETRQHWEMVKNHPILKKELISTEWSFNARIPDTQYWLLGRIDAIFYDRQNDKYIIADWKTGKYSPKNPEESFQHKIYLLALLNSYKDFNLSFQPENLVFHYIKTIDNSGTIISFSEEKRQEYQDLILNNITEIENSNEYAKPSFCPIKNCQYSCLCR